MREESLIRNLLIQTEALTGGRNEGPLLSLLQSLGEKLRAAASFSLFYFAWNRLLFICSLEMQKYDLGEDEYAPNLIINDYKTIDEAMRAMIAFFRKALDGIRLKLYGVNKYIEKALVFMSKNYADTISLADVAREVYVSNAYLSRLFSKETGRSFTDNLNLIRIGHARELLADRWLQISEVAYRVGFNDPKYFSQVFRKFAGCTPMEYKTGGSPKQRSAPGERDKQEGRREESQTYRQQ